MSLQVAVCDYGVGNLRSVERALTAAGAEPVVSADPGVVAAADALVLPGVGAFGAAADALTAKGMWAAVQAVAGAGRPVLGVCLGFQLLFEWSEESGGRAGLGLIPGRIRRLSPDRGKVPHMGWNHLDHAGNDPLLLGIASGTPVYFVHSYAAHTDDEYVVASCDYGGRITAACRRNNVVGTQFHPEKSGRDGLRMYSNFVDIAKEHLTAAAVRAAKSSASSAAPSSRDES